MLFNSNLSFIIGKNYTDPYVDLCQNVKAGDSIFARHPYKIFVVNEPEFGDQTAYLMET